MEVMFCFVRSDGDWTEFMGWFGVRRRSRTGGYDRLVRVVFSSLVARSVVFFDLVVSTSSII